MSRLLYSWAIAPEKSLRPFSFSSSETRWRSETSSSNVGQREDPAHFAALVEVGAAGDARPARLRLRILQLALELEPLMPVLSDALVEGLGLKIGDPEELFLGAPEDLHGGHS